MCSGGLVTGIIIIEDANDGTLGGSRKRSTKMSNFLCTAVDGDYFPPIERVGFTVV